MSDQKAVFAKGRIGWLGDYDGYLPFDPEVIDICTKSLSTFEAMGLVVETVPAEFDMDALWQAWRVLRHFSSRVARRQITPMRAPPRPDEAGSPVGGGKRRAADGERRLRRLSDPQRLVSPYAEAVRTL